MNKTCTATTECNFPVGCDASTGNCILQNITSLIDFCGECLGDSASCFFSSVYPVSNIGAIAGGAVAGIVVGCIIAALIFIWLSKKGYDYYKNMADLSSVNLQNNPTYQDNRLSGELLFQAILVCTTSAIESLGCPVVGLWGRRRGE